MSLDEYTTQYAHLNRYLGNFLIEHGNSTSGKAKDKLSRLSQAQFGELCKDVSDEINRRGKDPMELPFLPVRTDFPQKRNQARQKLATLTENRFQELSCEIFQELKRRYPQIPKQFESMHGPNSSSSHRSPPLTGGYMANEQPPMNIISPPNRHPPRGLSRPAPGPGPRRMETESLERLPHISQTPVVRLNNSSSAGSIGLSNPPMGRDRDREREERRKMREHERELSRGREREGSAERERGYNVGMAPLSAPTQGGGISREEYDRIKNDMARMKSDYESEISDLKKKVINAPTEDELLKIKDDNRILVSDLRNERDISLDYQKQLNKLKDDHTKKSDALDDLNRKLKDYENRIDQLVGDMEHLTAENTHLKEENEEFQDQIRILKEENENNKVMHNSTRGISPESSYLEVPMKMETSSRRPSFADNSFADATVKLSPNVINNHRRLDSGKGDLYDIDNKSSELDEMGRATEALLDAAHGPDPTEVLLCMKTLIVHTKGITERATEMEPRVKDDNDFNDLAQAKDDTTDAIASVMELAKDHASSGNKKSVIILEDEVDHLMSCSGRLVAIMEKLSSTKGLLHDSDAKYQDSSIKTEEQYPITIQQNQQPMLAKQPSSGSNKSYRLSVVQDLAYMIEDQTDIIVELIHNTITSFKSPNFAPPEAKKQLDEIVIAVEDIEYEFHRAKSSIDNKMKSEFEQILNLLLADVGKLSEYGDILLSDPSRTTRQKIGTISFEIAKNVKALLALFDNI